MERDDIFPPNAHQPNAHQPYDWHADEIGPAQSHFPPSGGERPAPGWATLDPHRPAPGTWPGLPSSPPVQPSGTPYGGGATMVPPPPPRSGGPSSAPGGASGPARPERPSHAGRRLAAGLATAVLVAGAAVGGGVVGTRLESQHDQRVAQGPVSARTVVDKPASGSSDGSAIDAVAVLHKMSNSVVAIQAQVTTDNGPWQSEQGEAAGTGIVIDGSGDILTNAHVVANETSLTVTLPGSTQARPATLVGSDPSHDVAVVHVDDTTGLVPATLASSDDAQVGEGVVAIGNALALQGSLTVTEGIVSASNRSIQTENANLTGLLQTDAAISSGNSGGALVDAQGVVIGMNTAVASSSGDVQASNIGFAIPIRSALDRVAPWLQSS